MPRLTREAEKCFEEERFLLTPKSLSWIDGPLERASLAPVHGCVTSNASPESRSRKMLRGGEIFVDTKKPFMDRVRFSERGLAMPRPGQRSLKRTLRIARSHFLPNC